MDHIEEWIFLALTSLIVILSLFSLEGCVSPRVNSLYPLQFSEQAMTSIMRVSCNKKITIVQGVFICEEKEPRKATISVKIMPTPGRVIFSNGLQKLIHDFNYVKEGFWIWKKTKISDTWVDLDIGELNSIFGDMPVSLDIVGQADNGIIVNRGMVYYRLCNDKEVRCSDLIITYDCVGAKQSTGQGLLGSCNRMSGTSQGIEIPTSTINYKLSINSKIIIVSGKTNFQLVKTLNQDDINKGLINISYPILDKGPDLIGIRVINGSEIHQTYLLLVGYDPHWTGIDKPHYIVNDDKLSWSLPITSDLMEVIEDDKRKVTKKDKIDWDKVKTKACGYAWDRESGSITYSCIDSSLNEVPL